MTYDYEPSVNETQEFIEIANDFANPLDIVREAISNSYDARASEINMIFDTVVEEGESIFKIVIEDNGRGMDESEMKAFFDLGNSTRKNDDDAIGEKGHGTKVYFNSRRILVTTYKNGNKIVGEVKDPYRELHANRKPKIHISVNEMTHESGTIIEIWEYNKNRREKFTHENIKDYIKWFTRHGGIDIINDDCRFRDVIINLKGLDKQASEQICFGHVFPSESDSLEELLDTYNARAPDYYCKRIMKNIHLKNHPEIEMQIVFSIEGKNVKYNYNNMIRRPGYQAPFGAYTTQERYGLWLCKDYIPVQRKNEWVTIKGQEFTRFQAFANCQSFKLTANRGSIENTPTELLTDIENSVRQVFNDIILSSDWTNIEWLESEVNADQTVEKERKNYDWRIAKVKRSNIGSYNNHILVEPKSESGVFSIFLILSTLDESIFPFTVLDYDTHEGIDVIVKGDSSTPIQSARLFYVEFKYVLENNLNHSFENIHSIVCWDTAIKNDDEIIDLSKESRKMIITQPGNGVSYTTYMLDNPRRQHKITVFVLKDYLREKLGIIFRQRTGEDPV
jgi:hypothetical protein